MHAKIHNFRGITDANLDIAPLALVTGGNGAGKTSILQAVAAALTGQPIPYLKPGSGPGQYTATILKKSAGVLVNDGNQDGSVTVSGPGGTVSVSWPSAKVRRQDARQGTMAGAPRASVFAAGLVDLMTLDDKARSAYLIELLGASPTDKEIEKALGDARAGSSTKTRTINAIRAHGWEYAAGKIKESISQDKGQWRAITGESYGVRKAETWQPVGWTDDLAGIDAAQLHGEETRAREALETAIGQQAVSAEEIKRLKGQAAIQVDLSALEETAKKAETAHREAARARDALPSCHVDDGRYHVQCPHCKQTSALVSSAAGGHILHKVEPLDKKERDERLGAIARADGALSNLQGKMWDAQRKLTDGRSRIREAEAAKKRLQSAKNRTITAEQVEDARQKLARAVARLKAVGDKSKADTIHETIKRKTAIADVLAPDGLRRQKLIESLEEINDTLEKLADKAGWKSVHLGEDLNAWYDGRPHALLSESEKYRFRTVFQLAIAQRDGSAMILLDGADILDQAGRNGLFKMLRSTKIPALVAMTANDRAKVLDLARAGIGRSYWVEGGAIADLSGNQGQVREAA